MKIEPFGEQLSFDSFCRKYGITMVAHERNKHSKLERWYVSSKQLVEISEGIFLTSRAGNGDTIEAALEDYKRGIAGRTVKINNDYYVNCPNEWLED